MLRHPGGGAVAIVAPAREGVPIFHGRPFDPRDGKTQDGTTQLLTRYWIEGLSGDLTTGEALARAKAGLAKDAKANEGYHWVLCELNLLGDPTLDMRARDPITPTVKAPERLALGVQTVTVEAGAPGLTVCLWKGDEVYAVETTDAAGKVAVEIEIQSAGALLLTVTGPSANAVTRTLTVGASPAKTRRRF